jgi:hypothetical protein
METIALILEQTQGQIRFCVDDVKPTQERLPTQAAKLQLEQLLETKLLAFSHNERFQAIQNPDIHPLAFAVHAAFSKHRPLQLTPDIIWMTLAQGFAQHVNNHAETLRSRFVKHQGKQELTVEVDEFPTQAHQWAEKIQEWVFQIRDRVGPDLHRLLECNFSTTTPITRTASYVVMMDAFRQYFDYVMVSICGIPDITLLGTIEDWQSICDRVQMMAQYDLNWWTDRLLPICQEFVETAAGRPSLDFWRCIYKPEAIYSGELISGWLADLFPYIKHGVTKAPTVRNPLLGIDRCDLPSDSNSDSEEEIFDPFGSQKYGIRSNSLPLGLSEVPFKFKMKETGKEYSLELLAGFIGVHQDDRQGTLQPEIGWAVRERDESFVKLFDKIQQEHMTEPPINWSSSQLRQIDSIPKELVPMLERFNGATLYSGSGHSWHILKSHSWGAPYEVDENCCYFLATPFIDLEDGRCIAFNFNFRSGECWFLLGRRENEFKNPGIVAKSLLQLFEQIFEAEGSYYFDYPSFITS